MGGLEINFNALILNVLLEVSSTTWLPPNIFHHQVMVTGTLQVVFKKGACLVVRGLTALDEYIPRCP